MPLNQAILACRFDFFLPAPWRRLAAEYGILCASAVGLAGFFTN
ncbi:hypothetical protein EDWATA_01545 [Edwardsiella tarda ATCC 23685]|uniref:Uncharacterized protein n=1 Tax=Edwardsiella tarda ATCC 23685 TaxID=500638 RepID=D4F476_EDWTA|nr:hypothetical protein EDWATA_01545 [Edwardsiella tarda ATCC 23685]